MPIRGTAAAFDPTTTMLPFASTAIRCATARVTTHCPQAFVSMHASQSASICVDAAPILRMPAACAVRDRPEVVSIDATALSTCGVRFSATGSATAFAPSSRSARRAPSAARRYAMADTARGAGDRHDAVREFPRLARPLCSTAMRKAALFMPPPSKLQARRSARRATMPACATVAINDCNAA